MTSQWSLNDLEWPHMIPLVTNSMTIPGLEKKQNKTNPPPQKKTVTFSGCGSPELTFVPAKFGATLLPKCYSCIHTHQPQFSILHWLTINWSTDWSIKPCNQSINQLQQTFYLLNVIRQLILQMLHQTNKRPDFVQVYSSWIYPLLHSALYSGHVGWFHSGL